MRTKRHAKTARSLEDAPFFRDVGPDLLNRISDYVFHREYELHQIVFFPDDPCNFVYWVREGRVRATRLSQDNRELTFRYALPGDMLGEECLVDPPARGYYGEAMAPSLLCLMQCDDFRRIARQEAEFGYHVARHLCNRVSETEQVLAEVVFERVRARIASALLRLCRRKQANENGTLRMTHQEVAGLVGSTRETTTAVLHQFREEGLVSIGNRRITILDPAGLERSART